MKSFTMIGPSVLIILFITLDLCFGQITTKQDLLKTVEHDFKATFEDTKGEFESYLDELLIETNGTGERVRSFGDGIGQGNSTGSLADSDDSEDDFDKQLNELIKQFEKLSKSSVDLSESDKECEEAKPLKGGDAKPRV